MKRYLVITCSCFLSVFCLAQQGILVLQTDFGVKDGAVAAMKGVAMQVSSALKIYDLTHEIPAYNIWEAAYRLQQTVQYWPKGTVFVSVVDPGVGSERASVVVKTKNGYYFVTPDNGTLTLIAQSMGIEAVRQIDEKKNRLPGSSDSYTFHGRDVFAYTAARLAAHKITFEKVGPALPAKVVLIDYQQPVSDEEGIKGNIAILDVQYGNVWTNIPQKMIQDAGIKYGDKLYISIYEKEEKKYSAIVPFVTSFSAVKEQQPLAYVNSLLNFSVAINMGDFAKKYNISSGADWKIVIRR